VVQKKIHKNKPLNVAFVDLEKTSGNVELNYMRRLQVKRSNGLQQQTNSITASQDARSHNGSHMRKTHRCQYVCNFSPALLRMYLEEATRKAQETGIKGIMISTEEKNTLQFANDKEKS
jgi:hypothetical protein